MTTIAVLNVNTTAAMTDAMVDAARNAAGPDISVIGLTPSTGVPACEGHVDSAYSTVAMLETLRDFREFGWTPLSLRALEMAAWKHSANLPLSQSLMSLKLPQ